MIYVQGYALVSAKGKDVFQALQSLGDDYAPQALSSEIQYYQISEHFLLPYYDMIEKVIRDALSHAEIEKKYLNSMALFFGTSSAKLPLNEPYLQKDCTLVHDLYMDEITEIMANRIGIKGFRTVISTACTSSANALVQAKEMMESGLIEHAVVVGVELYNLLSIKGFESFMLLSEDAIKPFDKNRSGLILGEAVSAIILSKEKSAFRVAGGAINIDTGSITAPSSENLEALMYNVLKSASIIPSQVCAVKTHATGTEQNDLAEAKALHGVFAKNMPHIVTLKPYIGHTMGACGSSELALFLESLKEGFIPKSKQIEIVDPACNIKPLSERINAKHGYYMFNNFGFGGNNSSIIIEYQRV